MVQLCSNAYGAHLDFSVLERVNAFTEAGGMMPAVSSAQCGQGARTCSLLSMWEMFSDQGTQTVK